MSVNSEIFARAFRLRHRVPEAGKNAWIYTDPAGTCQLVQVYDDTPDQPEHLSLVDALAFAKNKDGHGVDRMCCGRVDDKLTCNACPPSGDCTIVIRVLGDDQNADSDDGDGDGDGDDKRAKQQVEQAVLASVAAQAPAKPASSETRIVAKHITFHPSATIVETVHGKQIVFTGHSDYRIAILEQSHHLGEGVHDAVLGNALQRWHDYHGLGNTTMVYHLYAVKTATPAWSGGPAPLAGKIIAIPLKLKSLPVADTATQAAAPQGRSG
jgi:hypothetical protein